MVSRASSSPLALRSRGIPVRRLSSGSLVQLGYGARQHRIRTAETDATGTIASAIARDKDVTKSLLQSFSVPVPKGRVVASPEDFPAPFGDWTWELQVTPVESDLGEPALLTRAEVIIQMIDRLEQRRKAGGLRGVHARLGDGRVPGEGRQPLRG